MFILIIMILDIETPPCAITPTFPQAREWKKSSISRGSRPEGIVRKIAQSRNTSFYATLDSMIEFQHEFQTIV